MCNKNPNPTDEWSRNHELFCEINHKGSSGSMEKEGVVEMFLRSIDKHNLKYAEYIGDGDPHSFGAVKQELENKYGDKYQIEKGDTLQKIWILLFVHIRIGVYVLFYQI